MILSDLPLTDDHLGEIIARLNTLPHPFEPLPETPATAVTSRSFHKSATPLQGQSYMISQGCYGLSQDKPIGTQHVGNCVAIVLRNPQTNLTSLIHFDARTDPKSLEKAFEAFEGQPIEAAIIGAKYALEKPTEAKTGITDEGLKQYFYDTSRTNLLAVLGLLAAKNATLTSAWVADHDLPHQFVVDPKSGQMEVKKPSLDDPEQAILFAPLYFSHGLQEVTLAYDFRQSDDRLPTPLNAETTQFLEDFGVARATKTDDGLKEWLKDQEANPDNLDFFLGTLNHYQKSHASTPVTTTNTVQAPATTLTLS